MSNNNNEAKLQEELKALQEKQSKQGELVRELKKKGKDDPDFKNALSELEKLKVAVEAKQKELKPSKIDFPRDRFNRLMAQRFFIAPSFEIYGGVAGLYDLGPPGITSAHGRYL
jgi:glycyl-tRNA synthetase